MYEGHFENNEIMGIGRRINSEGVFMMGNMIGDKVHGYGKTNKGEGLF